MASLLDRIRTLISANLNYLVSQALKANSMAMVDEYIRKVEDNLEALEDAAATVGGEAKTLKRKYRQFEGQAKELDGNIDLFLSKGKDDLAQAAQYRYNTIQRLTDTYGEQYKAQEAEYQKLLAAKLKLEAKLTEAKGERTELQAMLDLAKSKELTHKVVPGGRAPGGSVLATGSSSIVDALPVARAAGPWTTCEPPRRPVHRRSRWTSTPRP